MCSFYPWGPSQMPEGNPYPNGPSLPSQSNEHPFSDDSDDEIELDQ